MLIPGALFGYFAGVQYWFPKAFGFRLERRWGVRAFWAWIVGFYLAFMPLYVLGFMGMPRRMEHYDTPAWQPLLIVAALGAIAIFAGIVCMIVQLVVSIRNRAALADSADDPWDGRTLEWATSSPPAPYNFALLPHVASVDAFAVAKASGGFGPDQPKYRDILLPADTSVGMIIGGSAFVFGFAMVWHIWWLAILAGCCGWAALLVRMFGEERFVRIPADAVAAIEAERRPDSTLVEGFA
jgi:cytochrome o ubiquinol oxidase subunit 1